MGVAEFPDWTTGEKAENSEDDAEIAPGDGSG